MFFTFDQINSGGFWHGRTTQHVIVEATDADAANEFVEDNTPVYFDGVSKGIDCDCCGPRWRRVWGKGDAVPSVYGEPLDLTGSQGFYRSVTIYFEDGRVITIPKWES